ncbi:MAG: homocysteine S-methyltransferase family protein [Verrucomicrobia bacterium]|nr:homocysteine S-methyltransferase family protein [Verrucomicrobiota bacterium]MDA1086621.1 homocysteine S-methyltransferase family protein [Verrucomicrobiota bacterium]
MSDFLTELRSSALLCDGATGSLLFERTGRLSETNHVYELFTLQRPELISEVHRAYLDAGARCIKSNTFGANHVQLRALGADVDVRELNRASVALAREAIASAQGGASGEARYVLASMGPTGDALGTPQECSDCYLEQVESLIEAGADALLLETFRSLDELEQLIDLIHSVAIHPPIIAQMAIQQTGAHGGFVPELLEVIDRLAGKGVAVAGVNCCSPWDAGEFVEAAIGHPAVKSGELMLSAMPNAGGFQRIGHRFLSAVNTEYAGKMARSFLDRGVRLIGGCCEMHPPFIAEMRNYIHARQSGDRTLASPTAQGREPAGDAQKRGNGPFSRKLFDGEFVVSVEHLPPRGTNPKIWSHKVQFVKELSESGLADALDITDGSRGIPLMPPGDFVQVIRDGLGWRDDAGDRLELIPHFTSRDLNLMGIQSRLMGYHACGISNVIFITGDPPKMSPAYPRSSAVFDMDSVTMIHLTHACLNAGVDFGGNALGKHDDPRTHFTIGTGFEPEALDMARELAKLERKLERGADYVMTQPAFRHEPLEVLAPYRDRTRVLVGVMVLSNTEHARRVSQVPGVVIPSSVLDRLGQYDDAADQARAGAEIAAEQIQWIGEEGWSGLYLMAPASHDHVIDILRQGLPARA